MPTKLLIFMLSCVFPLAGIAQPEKQEANLKAVFIYNFTKYVNWDAGLAEDNFIIGVIGPSDLTTALIQISKTSKVDNKKIVVRQFNKPEDIEFCHILFIPQKSPFTLSSILDKVSKDVLTVSEETGYASQGTAFNFVIVNDKLKFEANLKAIDAAGLKASSQLLKLAIIVD